MGPPDGPICHPTSNVDDIWCIMIFYNFDGSSITPRWLPPNLWFQKNVCQRVSRFVTLFSDNVIVLRGKNEILSRYVTVCHAPAEYSGFGFYSNHAQYPGSRQ